MKVDDYLFDKMLKFIKDETLRITILKDKVNIINYQEILSFDDKKVKIKCVDTILAITGDDLIINKLVEDEILIIGTIKSVELL